MTYPLQLSQLRQVSQGGDVEGDISLTGYIPPPTTSHLHPAPCLNRLTRQERRVWRGLAAGYSRADVRAHLGMAANHMTVVVFRIREKGWSVPAVKCGPVPVRREMLMLAAWRELADEPHRGSIIAKAFKVSKRTVYVNIWRARAALAQGCSLEQAGRRRQTARVGG